MLRKNIHILYGVGIGVLLVALIAVFNHYWDSQPNESAKNPEAPSLSTEEPQNSETTCHARSTDSTRIRSWGRYRHGGTIGHRNRSIRGKDSSPNRSS